MPEFSLSLGLHLHHCGVSVLDVLQRFFNSRKQVNNFLLADQDLTVGRKADEGTVGTRGRDTTLYSRGQVLPEVCVQVFEDLVLVLDSLNDGLHHLRAVSARVCFRRWWRQNSSSEMHPSDFCSHQVNAALLTFAFHLQLLVELNGLFFSATKINTVTYTLFITFYFIYTEEIKQNSHYSQHYCHVGQNYTATIPLKMPH